jgi:uncharacterized protein with von Willebrand factor type A (vWA) domain
MAVQQQQFGITITSATSLTPPQKMSKPVVYAVIDTSGSMAGSKIKQVANSLREIIAKAPDHVIFVVRTFDTNVKTLVAKTKAKLDVERLMLDLEKAVGGGTALYDAWGQTINEIRYDGK